MLMVWCLVNRLRCLVFRKGGAQEGHRPVSRPLEHSFAQHSGFRVPGSRGRGKCRVWSVGCRLKGVGCRVQGVRWVQGVRCRV